MWAAALTRMEVLLAGIAILAAVKSYYNGTIGEMITNIRRIPHMEEQQDEIKQKQEDLVDAVVATAVAEGSDEHSVDVDELDANLRDERGYRDFLSRNHSQRGPFADVEDEEEVPEEELRWRNQTRGDD